MEVVLRSLWKNQFLLISPNISTFTDKVLFSDLWKYFFSLLSKIINVSRKIMFFEKKSFFVFIAVTIYILGSITFLYPPQRGYISFVNTFVTPRTNDLGPYVPWRYLLSAKFYDIWAMSVCPSERKELQTWKFAHRLLLLIRWLVLKMGNISQQDLVPNI